MMMSASVITRPLIVVTLITSRWINQVVAMDTEAEDGPTTDNGTDFHDDDHQHHGVHLASINFDYVKQPLVITFFLLIVAICKLGDL